MIVLGTLIVYTRGSLDDAWIERPQLRLGGAQIIERIAGQVSAVCLEQSFTATTVAQPQYVDWTNHWCRITYTPDGGEEVDLWYGHLSDQTLHEDRGVIVWGGLSIESQLQRVQLADAYAVPIETGGDARPITMRSFNETLDDDRRIGYRGSPSYDFRRDENFCAVCDPESVYAAYAFGVGEPWNAYQLLRALTAWHVPAGGSRYSRIGFKLLPTPAAQTALESLVQRWDIAGRTLYDVLARICRTANLSWHCDWSADDPYDYDFVRIRLWSRALDDRDEATQGSHAVAGPVADPTDIEARDSRVTIRVTDRATEVMALGAPIRVMLTVRRDPTGYYPGYERGWTDDDELVWALPKLDRDPEAGNYDHVFRRYYFPHDQKEEGEGTWQIAVQPDPQNYDSVVGDMAPFADLRHVEYPRPRRILPHLLTRVGYVYTSQASSPLSVNKSGAEADPEFHRPLAWYIPPTAATTHRIQAIEGVRPLRHETGINLPRGYRDLGDQLNLSQNVKHGEVDDGPAWEWLRFTIAVELDCRLAWRASVDYNLGDGSGERDEQRRIETIDVEGAEWWVALPGTAIAYDAYGGSTIVSGVLRNDLPRLKAAAERLLERRGHRLWHADLSLRAVRTDIELGDFVARYGRHTLNNPVVGVMHSFAEGRIGTQIATGRPWRRSRW